MADTTPEPGPGGPWAPPEHPVNQRASHLSTALAHLLDADRTAVVIVDGDGEVENLNAAMLTLLDVTGPADVRPGTRAHAEIDAFLDQLPQELRRGETGSWSGDVDHPNRRGDTRVLRATALVVPTADGRARISLLLHDVSDARRQLTALRREATHDTLTGFVHRHRMLADLAEAIGHRRSADERVAVISIDLDQLKHVNDALGHDAGDQLLTSVAQRLEYVLRPDDRIARVGGDEFLVMCRSVTDATAALELAQRVERALRGAAAAGELSIEVAASVGVSIDDPTRRGDRSDDLAAATELVSEAETAMYDAKRSGGSRAALHRPPTGSTSRDRARLTASLQDALDRGAVTVEYQPVFSLVSRRATGAEALARWHHPTQGPVDPSTFITVAEDAGLIGRLGQDVLERAMHDLRTWIDAGTVDDDFSLHVNVSTAQLSSPRFVGSVLAGIERHRLTPGQLVLDARETALVTRPADVDRSIRALRRHGVRIALDDFGVGPQALDLLTGIGADVVKLDGSLALPDASSEAQTRLVRAVVLLAHALDISVVAERVDGIEQLHRLQAVGCDLVQGNLLSRPAAAADLATISSVTW